MKREKAKSKGPGRLNDQPPKPKGVGYINPDHMKIDVTGNTPPARNIPTKPAR